jgi:hypothetical protein
MMVSLLFLQGGKIRGQSRQLLIGVTLGQLMHDGGGLFPGFEIQHFDSLPASATPCVPWQLAHEAARLRKCSGSMVCA